jgi:hypothetical protein
MTSETAGCERKLLMRVAPHLSSHLGPPRYKKICTHLVYNYKHDGRHKARMVARGHLIAVPIDTIYS